MDTLTDSNTRERRPYECDGLVAGANRALLQADPLLARHSYAWVLEVPTWPVEWQQMSALLVVMVVVVVVSPTQPRIRVASHLGGGAFYGHFTMGPFYGRLFFSYPVAIDGAILRLDSIQLDSTRL